MIPKAHKFGRISTPRWKRWLYLDFRDDTITVKARRSLDSPYAFFEGLQGGRWQGKQLLFTFTATAHPSMRRQGGPDSCSPTSKWTVLRPSSAGLPSLDRGLPCRRSAYRRQRRDCPVPGGPGLVGGATVHHRASWATVVSRETSADHRSRSIGRGCPFRAIILAAPDISVELFQDLARHPTISQRTTMYVSARDRASNFQNGCRTHHEQVCSTSDSGAGHRHDRGLNIAPNTAWPWILCRS